MADEFPFLTDSDDERAVEDVLSQALDHSVLEQIADINCSSFSTSDNLPSDLENRFRKLKSLPTTTTAVDRFPPSRSKSFTPDNKTHSNLNLSKQIPDLKKCSIESPSVSDPEHQLHSDGYLNEKKRTNSISKRSEKSSPVFDPEEPSDGYRIEKKSTNSISKPKISSKTDAFCKPKGLRSRSGTDSRSVSSPESDSGGESPPRRGIGCLWCSPKKEKRKQGKDNRFSSSSSFVNEYDDEFIRTFSVKEQKKIMKKVMKEEEKINKEAEKIVKWAKQASARMVVDVDVSDLDDELDYSR